MKRDDSKLREGDWLWSPDESFASDSNLSRFQAWLRKNRDLDLDNYEALWQWSVTKPAEFWASLWDYFDIQSDASYEHVMMGRDMEHTRWFLGARLNYAEHLLRHVEHAKPGEPAFLYQSERGEQGMLDWHELAARVRVVATWLRSLGIKPGDRVASYMSNVPETAIAMMAAVAVGAIWSSASPEFGVQTVVDRFGLIKPMVLFAADGYCFGGREFHRREQVGQILAKIPSVKHVVWLDCLNRGSALPDHRSVIRWSEIITLPPVAPEDFSFARLAPDHPLWILFSSGTTGLPKAIVHGHGGMLVEHLKLLHFHLDLKPGDRLFFYTSTGWMMWNVVIAALLCRSAAVLYDGSPVYPDPAQLWRLAADNKATCFGASPSFVSVMEKAGVRPTDQFDLSALKTTILSGAPATAETFAWFYEHVKSDLWVTSQSGGTDLCSALVGAVPTLPVHAGEIQARALGINVECWRDDASPALPGEVGELVVTRPFPSQPVGFWNDDDGSAYHQAYFDYFPGVWRHGDLIKFNARGGCYIYGRSDSTLNRHGVRIGTAEIYRIVEQLPEVADSLVICLAKPDEKDRMLLFVQLVENIVLDYSLYERIKHALKENGSPRHVPDWIVQTPGIPYTLTAKKMEVPVRRIIAGSPVDEVASRDVMMNPVAIDWYAEFAVQLHNGAEPG